MPRFSANISTLFTEHPVLDRFAAARAAGFAAVEMQFPYDLALDELLKARKEAQVEVVLINFPAGDWEAGDRGIAGLPDRAANFRASIPLGRIYCEALGCRRINVLAGVPAPDQAREQCLATLKENLRFAAAEMDLAGVRVLLEAINREDVPEFLIGTSTEALDAIAAAGHPNLALQYDIYHMHIMEGGGVDALEKLCDRIGHIQFADAPGRHEPGTGDIDFSAIFAALDRMGYHDWVGAEYFPSADTAASLGWFAPHRK